MNRRINEVVIVLEKALEYMREIQDGVIEEGIQRAQTKGMTQLNIIIDVLKRSTHDGLTAKQITEATGLPEGSVRTTLYHNKDKFDRVHDTTNRWIRWVLVDKSHGENKR